ncbi:MAG: hypothetical protein GY953_11195, partial [bacterium]|nr:hypothetical protein [bacterium]
APHGELASSQYCLADPGREYLVYLPGGGSVAVDLSATDGPLTLEWFNTATGRTAAGGTIHGGGRRLLTAPFGGPAVIHLSAK